jgi:hypothetical protein
MRGASPSHSYALPLAALGGTAICWAAGLLLAGSGSPLPAGAFVLLPALLTGAAGVQLRRPASQVIVGSVVAGVLGGLSLIAALAWFGPVGVLE